MTLFHREYAMRSGSWSYRHRMMLLSIWSIQLCTLCQHLVLCVFCMAVSTHFEVGVHVVDFGTHLPYRRF